MVTHSGTLAWRIPWREETGRLQSMGSQRVGHDNDFTHFPYYLYMNNSCLLPINLHILFFKISLKSSLSVFLALALPCSMISVPFWDWGSSLVSRLQPCQVPNLLQPLGTHVHP